MLQIGVKADVDAVRMKLLYLQNEGVRKAAAVALNDTAFAARKDVQWFIGQVFDRPTPWTLNAPWVEKARPAHLAAMVTLQGKNWRHRASAFEYLGPHMDAGPRSPKRMEKLLALEMVRVTEAAAIESARTMGRGDRHDADRGLLGANEYLVPSKFQPLDQYGNVPRSVVQKILANLQAHFDPHQHTPWGGARGGKKKGEYYFTRRGVRGARLTAIWRRLSDNNAVPAFIVVTGAPRYRKRLPFEKIVQAAVARVWPVEFERQVLAEIRR